MTLYIALYTGDPMPAHRSEVTYTSYARQPFPLCRRYVPRHKRKSFGKKMRAYLGRERWLAARNRANRRVWRKTASVRGPWISNTPKKR